LLYQESIETNSEGDQVASARVVAKKQQIWIGDNWESAMGTKPPLSDKIWTTAFPLAAIQLIKW
jgi:hypothetical protein